MKVPALTWFTRLRRTWARPAPRLNLALQGGGAHGAFTWGVLDALLARQDLEFEGISGASAGAMNAVLLAEGWRKGGRDGARESLSSFWSALGDNPGLAMLVQGDGEEMGISKAGKFLMRWAGRFAPAQLNPLDLNRLRDLLNQHVDFEALRANCPFKLFIAATQANSGKVRLFRETELSSDVLLASACLPKIHRAVQIDGEPYWDGAYSANPAVYPLFYECRSRDVLLVLLSPLKYDATPHSVEQIAERTLEIAFSANFMREMRMFADAKQFVSAHWLALGRLERRLRAMRFHMLDTSAQTSLQRTDTKALAHGPFLDRLRGQGRACAQDWIEQHAHAVGRKATLDLKECFG
ncbi:MAG: patatin-like phospholipase family protein [Burkholderiaceae bacterium]